MSLGRSVGRPMASSTAESSKVCASRSRPDSVRAMPSSGKRRPRWIGLGRQCHARSSRLIPAGRSSRASAARPQRPGMQHRSRELEVRVAPVPPARPRRGSRMPVRGGSHHLGVLGAIAPRRGVRASAHALVQGGPTLLRNQRVRGVPDQDVAEALSAPRPRCPARVGWISSRRMSAGEVASSSVGVLRGSRSATAPRWKVRPSIEATSRIARSAGSRRSMRAVNTAWIVARRRSAPPGSRHLAAICWRKNGFPFGGREQLAGLGVGHPDPARACSSNSAWIGAERLQPDDPAALPVDAPVRPRLEQLGAGQADNQQRCARRRSRPGTRSGRASSAPPSGCPRRPPRAAHRARRPQAASSQPTESPRRDAPRFEAERPCHAARDQARVLGLCLSTPDEGAERRLVGAPIRFNDLGERPVRDGLAVGQAAPDRGLRLGGHVVEERPGQRDFPMPAGPSTVTNLGLLPHNGLVECLPKESEFRRSTNETRHSRARQPPWSPGPRRSVATRHRHRLSLQRQWLRTTEPRCSSQSRAVCSPTSTWPGSAAASSRCAG